MGSKATKAIPALLEVMVEDRNEDPRYEAFKAIEKIGIPEEVASLYKKAIISLIDRMQNDESKYGCRVSAKLLGMLGVEEAVPVLIKELDLERADTIVKSAAEALIMIGGKSAIFGLIALLKVETNEVLIQEIENLLIEYGEIAVPILEKQLIKEDKRGQKSFVKVLECITSKKNGP